ncbi:MAG: hypothetical protein ACI4WH_06175 [Oscillospiraceae bacterium]
MVRLKRILITLLFLGLIILFAYGYIKVYTNSYNTMHHEKITAFSIEYEDRTIYLTVCGKDFNLKI